ncbi:MAG: formyltransferase family protein [Candidatus Omnitrophota bacterium]
MKTRMTKAAIFAADQPGYKALEFCLRKSYPVEFVATSRNDKTRYEQAIVNLCRKSGVKVFRKIDSCDEAFIAKIKQYSLDLVFLTWWPDIIPESAINVAKIGWVNMHSSLLPYGRGKHSSYWTIIEGSPFGVTLHFINKGIDTGLILFQKKINVKLTHTGEDLFKLARNESVALFKKSYGKIRRLEIEPQVQDNLKASYHKKSEIDQHSCISLDKQYKAVDLLNIIRARSFKKGPGAYFVHEGKKYVLKLTIEEQDGCGS